MNKKAKKEDKVDEKTLVKETVDQLFKLLEIEGNFDLNVSEEGVEITLETNDSAVVIGYHGENLESLQLVLALCISRKIGRFMRVSIEVGDYKKNRIEWLKNLAQSAKERAKLENSEIALPRLKSWERRVIHLFLEDDKEVASESVGEGRDRTLVIRPRE